MNSLLMSLLPGPGTMTLIIGLKDIVEPL